MRRGQSGQSARLCFKGRSAAPETFREAAPGIGGPFTLFMRALPKVGSVYLVEHDHLSLRTPLAFRAESLPVIRDKITTFNR